MKQNLNSNQEQEVLLGDVYHQILSLFVSKDKLKPELMAPFIQENFAIATDAHAVICFKKELLGETKIEANEKAPNALAVIPTEENMSIEFDSIEMRKQILKSRKLADEIFEVTESKCPDCDGYGFVDYKFSDYKGNTHKEDMTCPTCENENEWLKIINRKTGEEVDRFFKLFRIKDSLIDVELFEKLVKTAEILSVEKIKLVYSSGQASPRKFIVGECIVCLMPVYKSNDQDLILNIS